MKYQSKTEDVVVLQQPCGSGVIYIFASARQHHPFNSDVELSRCCDLTRTPAQITLKPAPPVLDGRLGWESNGVGVARERGEWG
jgi:hypothetical protein